MSNLITHAKREFLALGYIPLDQPQEDGPNKWIQESVLKLLEVFGEQGHSGFSAPYCIQMFKKLAGFKPLCPLQGTDDEWADMSGMSGEPMWQNKRACNVFKGADGRAYQIDGIVFEDPDGSCWTNGESRKYIESFPYTPTQKTVKRGPEPETA